MLGSADAFHDTRTNTTKKQRGRREREKEKKGKREDREAWRKRRRARWKRASGKGREKIPCMHSCNTLPWSDCTSGNATPINHRRPRFFHGTVREERTPYYRRLGEKIKKPRACRHRHTFSRAGDLINLWKKSWENCNN